MNAPAAPLPSERPDPSARDWLTPRSWRLEDEPPGAAPWSAQATEGEPPLLWLIDRRQPLTAELTHQLGDSLTHEERQRLQAYRLGADRERFLLGRGGLRRLLAAWLGLEPQEVTIETGTQGKPHCPGGPRFNLSHSGDLILLALHPSRAVGVDVERLRPELDWQRLAERLLSSAERSALEACPPTERPDAFLGAWCRLEAQLKARGLGLAGLQALRHEEAAAARGPADRVREPQGQRVRGGEGSAEESRCLTSHGSGGEVDRGADHPGIAVDSPAPEGSERIWEVAVPCGYRAAAALAPDPPADPAPEQSPNHYTPNH